jgi:outer membrane protein assembly factor BamB
MNIATKLAGIGVFAMLAGCSTFDSINPFHKPPPGTLPAVLGEFKPTLAVRTVWTSSIGRAGASIFSPAYAANSVFFAGADGAVARADAATGRGIWRINAGSKLTAGVASDGETVAVVAAKGQVMAFDGDGMLRWKAQASSEVLSTPAIGDGLVIVRSVDNHISAFDVRTGERRWVTQRNAPPLILRGAPGLVIDNASVYAGMPGGKLLSLTTANGGTRWEAVVGEPRGATELERISDVSGLPVVVGGEVCATAYQGRIACFDSSSGVVRWSKELSSNVGPGLDERFVYVADAKGIASAFSRDAGQSVWSSTKLMNRHPSTPASFGRAVAYGDYKGFVHFLARDDGALIARVATDGSQIIGTPVVAGTNLILQTQSGTIVALAAE